MFKRLLFLVTALRAFRSGQPGHATDPRMRMVMQAINAWRSSRTAPGGGRHRSTGTLAFVLDAFRAFRASRGSPSGAAQSSGRAPSSGMSAIIDAVRAYRSARR